METRLVIVDGYNLMKTDPELAHYQSISLEFAREAVITRLKNASGLRGVSSVTVVFDGHTGGQKSETVERRGRFTIIYSKLGETADDVIKRLTLNNGGAVRVITRDSELRGAVGLNGATSGIMKRRPPRQNPIPTEDEDEGGWNNSTRKKGPAKRPGKKGRKPGPNHDIYW